MSLPGPDNEARSAQHPSNPVNPPPVASPCINVCQMDEVSGWCAGCLRNLDEIAFWSVLDDDDKRAVLAELTQRHTLWLQRGTTAAASTPGAKAGA